MRAGVFASLFFLIVHVAVGQSKWITGETDRSTTRQALVCLIQDDEKGSLVEHPQDDTNEPSLLSAGAGFGSPNGVFAIAGLYYKDIAVRVSGGAWKKN